MCFRCTLRICSFALHTGMLFRSWLCCLARCAAVLSFARNKTGDMAARRRGSGKPPTTKQRSGGMPWSTTFIVQPLASPPPGTSTKYLAFALQWLRFAVGPLLCFVPSPFCFCCKSPVWKPNHAFNGRSPNPVCPNDLLSVRPLNTLRHLLTLC